MDLRCGDNIFDNFRSYQRQLLRAYASMADEFDFRVLNGRQPVATIQAQLQRQIGAFLDSRPDAPEGRE